MFSAQVLIPHVEEERIHDMFDRFGPTPRLCIESFKNPIILKNYEEQLQGAISDLTIEQFDRLFRDSRSLTMNTISHKICLVTRENGFDGKTVVVPITQSINNCLRIVLFLFVTL